MQEYLVIYEEDGRIERVIKGDALTLAATIEREPRTFWITAERAPSWKIHYVTFGPEGQPTLSLRPVLTCDKTQIVADDMDYATIAGLPIPCTVLVDSVKHIVEDGSFEFASTMPARYTIEIDAFPYLPFTTTIRAIAPPPPPSNT